MDMIFEMGALIAIIQVKNESLLNKRLKRKKPDIGYVKEGKFTVICSNWLWREHKKWL